MPPPHTSVEKRDLVNFRYDILPFPNAEEFYDLLQDRLYMVLDQFFLSKPFTIFMTVLPRKERVSKIERKDLPKVTLISGGIDFQRKLLESEGNEKKELKAHWDKLKNSEITGEEEGTVSSKLYNSYVNHELSLEYISKDAVGTISSYFARLTEEERRNSIEKPDTRLQAEYHIVDNYLSVEDYWYVSLPLIQFAEFDGVAHIVMHDEDKKNMFNEKAKAIDKRHIRNAILAFSREYEGLILDWDLVEDNTSKVSAIDNAVEKARVIAKTSKNPIDRELKYLDYYQKHINYFKKRIDISNAIPGLLYKQSQKNAITTILIDSYAHNVSAHSLTALNWQFKERIKKVEKVQLKKACNRNKLKKALSRLPKEMEAFQTYMHEEVIPLIGREVEVNNNKNNRRGIANYPRPMSKELQPLLKFLLEKGAFWSGVTRDYGFGGEVNSLFHTLWDEFINNPLYLGTIASTENITTLNFKIIFYQPEDRVSQGGRVKKAIDTEGILATINIDQPRKDDFVRYMKIKVEADGEIRKEEEVDEEASYAEIGDEKLYYYDFPELRKRSNFVNPGRNYKNIREKLKQAKVFFPGGVVGRHAFFTMLENEIRNIKHYHGSKIQEQDKGNQTLTLVLSIQEVDVESDRNGERELYKIGVWLDVDTPLRQSDHYAGQSEYLVERRFNMLMQNIIDGTETKAPRLGGNYQDKVCAAMLFNNRFRSVQLGDDDNHRPNKTEDKERDRRYYPWIIPVTSTIGQEQEDVHEDFELTREWYQNNEFETNYLKAPHREEAMKKGRLKKYFHLWKGTSVKLVKDTDKRMWNWENPARFRFACVAKKEKEKLIPMLRKFGTIRVITHTAGSDGIDDNLLEAYKVWLQIWLKESAPTAFMIKRREQVFNEAIVITEAKYLVYDPDSELVAYFSQHKPDCINPDRVQDFVLAHGGGGGAGAQASDICYRSHGIYRTNFHRAGDVEQVQQDKSEKDFNKYLANTAEFVETLKTRIVIFDNRVRKRFITPIEEYPLAYIKQREDLYWQKLCLGIRAETLPVKGENSEWSKAKKNLLKGVHFLVIHLTYIENILKEKYGNQVPEDSSMIGFFVEKELIDIVHDEGGQLRDNFILVITSGRGRDEWWQKLKDSQNERHKAYLSFTTFRPVESIISVVEDNINKEDDIDLKHHLVKVLFGS